MVKVELERLLAAKTAECVALGAELSQLKVQLEAERSIGRANVRSASKYSALLAECKRRNLAGEDVVIRAGQIVPRAAHLTKH